MKLCAMHEWSQKHDLLLRNVFWVWLTMKCSENEVWQVWQKKIWKEDTIQTFYITIVAWGFLWRNVLSQQKISCYDSTGKDWGWSWSVCLCNFSLFPINYLSKMTWKTELLSLDDFAILARRFNIAFPFILSFLWNCL